MTQSDDQSGSRGQFPAPQGERLAAIDCGTNTIRLLIADHVDDRLIEVDRRMSTVRLGEGVDRTGVLAAGALERTWQACESYADVIRAAGASRLRFVATSASRDASNFNEFAAGVRARLGVEPEVVSGVDEALLSFGGATRGAEFEGPVLVFDIGGGSTEFVFGTNAPVAWTSLDIGCVRLTERLVASDPVSQADQIALQHAIHQQLDYAAERVPLGQARTLVGLAGTVTTVAALALGLPEYDPEQIHGAKISRDQVNQVVGSLLRQSTQERDQLAVMQQGRADVIVAGALILKAVMARCSAPTLVVSERDILDGIVWSLVG